MNKLGFIDLDDINPVAVTGAVLTAGLAVFIASNPLGSAMGNSFDVGWFWKIATAIVTFIIAYIIFANWFD